MTNLGNQAPRGEDDFPRRIAALERQIKQLMTQRTLESAVIGKGGITIKGGSLTLKALDGTVLQTMDADGITVEGDFVLNGNLIADSGTLRSANFVSGSDGWRLRPDGTVEVNSIVLRGGIIGNDALTSPVTFRFDASTTGGYPITVGGGAGTDPIRASASVTVPAGFTSAAVFACVDDGGWNGTASDDYLYSCINIGAPGAATGFASSSTTPSNTFASASTSFTYQLTGLSGGDTISAQSRPFTQSATWPADPSNGCGLSLLVFFFR